MREKREMLTHGIDRGAVTGSYVSRQDMVPTFFGYPDIVSRIIAIPEGHSENSPAFQRRERNPKDLSPEGTPDMDTSASRFSRPCGTRETPDWTPALKRRDIFIHVPPGQVCSE